jgi:hypothetical protein
VRDHHSIMGGYPAEGASQPEMKDRDGFRIAQMIFTPAAGPRPS